MQIKPDEITSILHSRIEGLDEDERRPHRGRHRAVRGRRHRPLARPGELQAFERLEFAPRRHRPGAEPGVRQRRRRALRALGADRRGRHRQAHGRAVGDPGGDGMLGRIVDPLGNPLDGKGDIETDACAPPSSRPPAWSHRQPVTEPMQTGVKAIDSMIPIGRGQRELIIGDRQTGKSAIALDTIINNRDKDLKCVYVAIGQRMATVVQLAETLPTPGRWTTPSSWRRRPTRRRRSSSWPRTRAARWPSTSSTTARRRCASTTT